MTLEERIKKIYVTYDGSHPGNRNHRGRGAWRAPLVVFDLQNQEPINLEITVGTEVERKKRRNVNNDF